MPASKNTIFLPQEVMAGLTEERAALPRCVRVTPGAAGTLPVTFCTWDLPAGQPWKRDFAALCCRFLTGEKATMLAPTSKGWQGRSKVQTHDQHLERCLGYVAIITAVGEEKCYFYPSGFLGWSNNQISIRH